jgi:hypothetical protein
MPSPRGGGVDAVRVSTSRSSVLANPTTCMSHSLACIEHASRKVYMSACPRRPLARLAKDVSELRRGSHRKIAWASLDSPIVQPMRVTSMQTTEHQARYTMGHNSNTGHFHMTFVVDIDRSRTRSSVMTMAIFLLDNNSLLAVHRHCQRLGLCNHYEILQPRQGVDISSCTNRWHS